MTTYNKPKADQPACANSKDLKTWFCPPYHAHSFVI